LFLACDQLVGTVYGWLYVPTGNLFDAEQGATAKAIYATRGELRRHLPRRHSGPF
jgi:hypothetical protein